MNIIKFSNLFIIILLISSSIFQLSFAIESTKTTNLTTNNWAVLVAGSNGYENYAHQANLCHSYHVLIEKGFDPEKIIVFSYDDVANLPQNPFKGKLFSWPTGNKTGYDVNAGCKIDYKTSEVSTENFINVMKGNATAMKGKGTGKVLKSTIKDKVFVYMNDHGGPGCFCFLDNCDLYSDDLQNTLQYMFKKKMYSELVFYVEACYSGSLFSGLPTDINVFATTSADPYQSAFFWYCGNSQYGSDMVDGKHIGTCLSGQYSTAWMHDCDTTNINKESVMKQYQIVKNKTTLSEATQYGTTSFANLSLSQFLGKQNGQIPGIQKVITYLLDKQNLQGVSGQDLKLTYLQNMYNLNKTAENKAVLDEYVEERQNQTQFFYNLADTFNASSVFFEEGYPSITNFQCYKNLNNLFDKYCGKFNGFTLQFRKIFVQMCESENKLSYLNDNTVLDIKFRNLCPASLTLFQPKTKQQ